MKKNRTVTVVDESDGSTDGRTMRRTRNRTAVISALLEMIREGNLHPGAAEIAERAGVSHRSIFRYFDDLNDLVRTAIDQAFRDAQPLSSIRELGSGDFDERVAALVDTRLALFEFVNGPMQLAKMRAYSIPSIDTELAAVAEHFREQIREHFATELAGVDRPEREYLVDGALVLTGYDSYSTHIRLLGSSRERIRAAWIAAIGALMRG
jgi:AcrR family transcriptional regulator